MDKFHVREFANRPAPSQEYLIEGILPLGAIGDISGMPGQGKSTLALLMADAVSQGLPWFGKKTRQMAVAWITGEASGKDAIHRDCVRLGIDFEESDILFIRAEKEMFRFDRLSECWITTDEGGQILKGLRDCRIGFAIIDTIGSVVAGLREIDNDQQRQLARHLRSEFAETSLLTISHTNQSSAKDDLSWRLHYLSRAGGNGFPGAIRWAAGVSELSPEEIQAFNIARTPGSRYVAFGISKYNEMPRPEYSNHSPAIFEIRADGGVEMVKVRHLGAEANLTSGADGVTTKARKGVRDERERRAVF
ncbi:AAA family ATPase [Tepidimonas charontis]|uniref:AAA domain protein n=1 Tax=Tepidimonas charontis TaxID=2267262 RepID=A0A554XH39_9BURK|nr:AAA family ATPase [Tepidimonas charontis]TSE35145.1 AAA domain protein [Tepidimonas charontis]